MAFNQASETPGLKQPDLSSTDPNSDGDVGLNLDDAVSEGVRLGYGVIEDQIRQAQRMASKLNPGNSGPAGASDEIGSLLNRLLQTYGDLNNGWIKVLNAAAGNPDLLKTILGNGQGGPNDLSGFRPDGQRPANGPLQNYGDIAKVWLEILSAASSNVDIINAIVGGSRPGQFEAGGFHNTGQRTGDDPIRAYANLIRIWLDVLKAAAGNGDILDSILSNGKASSSDQDMQSWDSPRSAFDSAGGSNTISLQIIADGPVEADVRFFGGHHETSSLVLQDLRSRENGAPPIRDVTLIEASKGEPMRIVARVPSDQPSGLYQGLILNQRDDAPVGVLGIKVSRS